MLSKVRAIRLWPEHLRLLLPRSDPGRKAWCVCCSRRRVYFLCFAFWLTCAPLFFLSLSQTKRYWGDIAQEWRNSYLKFTRSIASDPNIPYKTVDQHHLDALREILTQHELLLPQQGDISGEDGSLFDEQELHTLSMVWHKLAPWPDTVQGLHQLNKKFSTITLSNGNVSLLEDMVQHGSMPFTHIYSAEMFQSYKPSPKVYLYVFFFFAFPFTALTTYIHPSRSTSESEAGANG